MPHTEGPFLSWLQRNEQEVVIPLPQGPWVAPVTSLLMGTHNYASRVSKSRALVIHVGGGRSVPASPQGLDVKIMSFLVGMVTHTSSPS